MRTLIDALPYLAGGVALVALAAVFLSDPPGANEHDLPDYRKAAPVNDAPRSLRRWAEEDRQIAEEMLPAGVEVLPAWDDDILPPAPPGTDAGGSPLFGAVAVDMAVPTLTDDEVRRVADEWLREIAAEQRGEVDDLAYGHAVCWDGTCELGCPACAAEARMAGVR